MSTWMLAGHDQFSVRVPNSPGVGKESQNIEDLFDEEIASRIYETGLWQIRFTNLTESMNTILSECSESNWDGYGATPISTDAVYEAMYFISQLPSYFPIPEVVPEPDGDIGLEWYHDRSNQLVLAFGGKNVVTYAGIFDGVNKTHGSELFIDSIPGVITQNLRRLPFERS